MDARALARTRLCCIGPRTAEELRTYGVRADLVPEAYQAEGVLEALIARGLAGRRILLARAAVAREILPEQLSAAGALVDVVSVYRTVLPVINSQRVKELLSRRELQLLTFASSSTVRNFRALFDSREEMSKLTGEVPVACIGPITAKTAEEEGLQVAVMAGQNTIPALVEAIVEYCGQHASNV